MRWSDIAASQSPSLDMRTAQPWLIGIIRDEKIVDPEWYPVVTRWKDWQATFRVSNRLRIGEPGDSVLPIVSANTAQIIADEFDVVLPTAKLYDAIATQGQLISYVSLPHRKVDDFTLLQMTQNTAAIDARLSGGPNAWLYEVGKSWINSPRYNQPGPAGAIGPTGLRNGWNTGINYGAGTTLRSATGTNPWPSVSAPRDLSVWQPPGGTGRLYHDLDHVDISQKSPHLVHREVVVQQDTGEKTIVDIESLSSHPEKWRLVSHNGPINSLRIPTGPGGPSERQSHPVWAPHTTQRASQPKETKMSALLPLALAAVVAYLVIE